MLEFIADWMDIIWIVVILSVLPRNLHLENLPEHPGGIDHAGHQSPHLLFRLNRLDTIALGKIEADDVIPPAPRVADTQVNGYVIRPLLHVMVLQEERERPQAQFRELVGHKLM